MAFSPYGRLLWSKTATLTGAGTASSPLPIDITDVTDVWLSVYVVGTSTGTSPTLNVQLDVYDAAGNILPDVLSLTQLTGTPNYTSASAGLHIAGNGSMVLPPSCRVTWTLGGTNPVYPKATISLYGR